MDSLDELLGLLLAGVLLGEHDVRQDAEDHGAGDLRNGDGAEIQRHLLAAGIGVTVVTGDPGALGTLGAAWKILGFLSVPLLLWSGLRRLQGKMPSFLIHGILCVFLLTHIMNQYQRWCGDPQLMNYIFPLLGAVMLAFFAYYTAAFEAGCGARRMHLGAGLLAVLFCTAALSPGEYPFLYLGGISWALTDLCRLQPPPKEEETAYDIA